MKNEALAPRDPGMLLWWIEEDCLTEHLLRRFPCTSRRGPSDAVGSGWPRARGWSGWATDVEAFVGL